MKLIQSDLDFIFAQLTLPGNDPRNAPLGTVLDPTGIRDVQGIGNNIANPTWGAADQPFERLTGSVELPTSTPTTSPLTGTPPVTSAPPGFNIADFDPIDPATFPAVDLRAPGSEQFLTRGNNITIPITDITSPREISNLVVDQSSDALAAIGYVTPGEQKLAVLDDPSTTPEGRLNPFTGNVNPLPYSTFTTMLGQFFDHGLDFVRKGVDGRIQIDLLPSDPLYNDPRGFGANFMTASRTNTVQVSIGVESSDALLGKLGLTEGRFFEPVTVTPGAVGADGGVLMINKVAINIANNRSLANVAADINAQTGLTGVVASVNGSDLTLTASGESINTVSPFIDLSQTYGSQISHTVFLREYDANGKVTGALVSGSVDGASSLATWKDVKANALNIGITLNDKDVLDIPLVRLNADGSTFFDSNGDAWLIARHKVSGAVYFVQNTDIALNTVILQANGQAVAGGNLATVRGELVLQTMGHAFLDDMDRSANPSSPSYNSALLGDHFIAGDGRINENIGLTAIQEVFHVEHNRLLNDITGFMTAVNTPSIVVGNSGNNLIADLGLAENTTFTSGVLGTAVVGSGTVRGGNLVFNSTTIAIANGSTLDQVVAAVNAANATTGVAAVNNGGRLELLTQFYNDVHGNVWTGEMLFQAAKLVNEMEYQHMIFGEFARKLSPNITPFGVYDVTIDPSIKAEFAHAVYRFGHSMLTDTVGMTEFDPTTGLSTGEDKSVGLISAFLNPRIYTDTTAGEFAIGGSQQVGNGIDIWVTDALRNNLVGMPLDLATLNMTRARDAGMLSLNGVRADLFAQTGNAALKPYDSWLDFQSKMVHEETLVNFVMAYSRDTVLTLFGEAPDGATGTGDGGAFTIADWDALRVSEVEAEQMQYAVGLRAAGEKAIADGAFMEYDQGINAVDFWLGGLAEAKVPGGMLGSTFDFIFALQMIELQNADRFYYLNRLGGTNMLAEIEAQLFADVVMRTTGVENLYKDIFSVPDATLEMSAPTDKIFQFQLDLKNATVDQVDVHGVTQKVGTAGWVYSAATGWTFYGNQGDYLDARGLLNANGSGNASEVIGGTATNDRIHGGGGNDTVWGKAGDDTIEGGRGNDFLHGEAGNDTITDEEGDDWIWSGDGNDTVNAGAGLDNVFGGDGDDLIIGGTGADILDGGAGNDVIYGDNMLVGTNVDGFADADILTGGEGNDTLYGGQGNDALDGGEGDDVLIGGPGFDAMVGWTGNDTFIMDKSDTGFGNVMDGGLGFDTVDYTASNPNLVLDINGVQQQTGIWVNLSLAPATLTPTDVFINVEKVIGTTYNDTLEGGALIVNVYLNGANGLPTNTLDLLASTGLSQGFVVKDVFGEPLVTTLPDGRQSLVAMDMWLDGGAGNDMVRGGDGNDTLVGGVGTDTLSGGLGNDVYVVDSNNDVIIEGLELDVLGNPVLDIDGNTIALLPELQSIDRIETSLGSYSLAPASRAFIENLTYTGSGAFDGTGNALNNIITGGSGNDTLNGGTGTDTLVGGLGDDTYTVDSNQDVITENANEGTDLVNVSISYTLGANLENLTLSGNAGNSGTGNELANVITGNGGANLLSGADGADTLNGGGGNDTLVGGAGLDSLVGGTGNDVYVIGDEVDDDIITESANNGGTDTVQSTRNTYVLTAANVENLTFTGTGNFRGTGSDGANVVTGGAGNDTLDGGAGNDTLVGGVGNDRMIGGLGADSLSGGAGIDVFVYSNVNQSGTTNGTRDVITDFTRGQDLIDLSGIGTFTFIGTNNFTAANQLRYETTGGQTLIQGNTVGNGGAEFSIALTGATALSAADFIGIAAGGPTPPAPNNGAVAGQTFTGTNRGNTLNGDTGNDTMNGNGGNDVLSGHGGNDTINGGTGNDVINGGLGADVLTGGTGSDFFVFDTALGGDNVDRITDFSNARRNDDTIRLENAVFTSLTQTGTLSAAAFRSGAAAVDADDRIIYNSQTREIFYDADGVGGAAQILFATLDNAVTLTRTDFVVI
ncbi:peroxidase family protein [Hydrogenophaga sp.]|uniref:peroxidase family protein n=1 Tax=Hydrogenophaga sp. TaxID=1904254 RepID=UPI003F6C074C